MGYYLCAMLIIRLMEIQRMSKYRGYVFVLWTQQFDIATVVIFVTELRKMGLRVKVVGLRLRHLSGANGLTLVPDFSLDEALSVVEQAMCVMVPYPADRCQWLNNDPRLLKFFKQAAAKQCWFIVGPPVNVSTEVVFLAIDDEVTTYPALDQLIEFTRWVGRTLLDGDIR